MMTEFQAPPHSEKFEKAVLSAIWQVGWSLEGADMLTEEHFFSPATKILYREMVAQGGDIPDLQLMAEHLGQKGLLESVGGLSEIAEIYTLDPGGHHFQNRLRSLHVLKAKRAAVKAAGDLLEAAYLPEDDDSYLERSFSPMLEIHEIAAANRKTPSKNEVMKEIMQDFKDRVNGVKSNIGIVTPFNSFNLHLRGLHTKRVTVISAFPSSGKSLIAGQILNHAANDGHPSLMISIEMPTKTLLERNLVFNGDLPADAFYDPKKYANRKGRRTVDRGDLEKLKASARQIQNAPLFFEDPGSCTMAQASAMIRRHVRVNKVKVVVFDYLQRLKKTSKDTTEQHYAEASHEFQALAKELDIAIILLSQQNKEGGTKHAEAITEDADLVLSILKDRDEKSEHFGQWTGIMVRKDRHYGQNGRILPIYLRKEKLKFVDDPSCHHHTQFETE